MNSAVCYGIVKIFGAFFFWCLIFARSACIIFFSFTNMAGIYIF